MNWFRSLTTTSNPNYVITHEHRAANIHLPKRKTTNTRCWSLPYWLQKHILLILWCLPIVSIRYYTKTDHIDQWRCVNQNSQRLSWWHHKVLNVLVYHPVAKLKEVVQKNISFKFKTVVTSLSSYVIYRLMTFFPKSHDLLISALFGVFFKNFFLQTICHLHLKYWAALWIMPNFNFFAHFHYFAA